MSIFIPIIARFVVNPEGLIEALHLSQVRVVVRPRALIRPVFVLAAYQSSATGARTSPTYPALLPFPCPCIAIVALRACPSCLGPSSKHRNLLKLYSMIVHILTYYTLYTLYIQRHELMYFFCVYFSLVLFLLLCLFCCCFFFFFARLLFCLRS